MKIPASKLLFYYCAAVSLFIAVSTVLTSQSGAPVIFATLFLPVVGYFVVEFFRNMRSSLAPSPEIDTKMDPKINKPEMILMGITFLVLLGFGINNISKTASQPKADAAPTQGSQLIMPKKSTPEPTTKKSLTISVKDGSESVNIRKGPTIFSDKIGTAKDGQVFEYTEKKGEWYEVLTENGLGYISFKYVNEEALQ